MNIQQWHGTRINKYLTLFFYLASVIAVAVFLYQYQLIVPVSVQDELLLILSIVFLFVGFLFQAVGWQYSLAVMGIKIRLQMAIASVGMTVFAKYLPGKVWMVLGRAHYVASKRFSSLKETSIASLIAQLVSLVMGCFLGSFTLIQFIARRYALNFNEITGLLALFAALIGLCVYVAKRHFRRRMISGVKIWTLLLSASFLSWLCWGVGFMLFSASIGFDLNAEFISVFAAGALLGILAVFMPGGLGVREAVIIALLIVNGMDNSSAVTLSIAARVWFLAGEGMLFLAGLTAHFKQP